MAKLTDDKYAVEIILLCLSDLKIGNLFQIQECLPEDLSLELCAELLYTALYDGYVTHQPVTRDGHFNWRLTKNGEDYIRRLSNKRKQTNCFF